MFDKVLLIILIIMLPIGIILSRQFGGKLGNTGDQQYQDRVQKIEDLLTQLNDKASNVQPLVAEDKKITLTGIVPSSTSGSLRLAGTAPYGDRVIWGKYTLYPVSEIIPELGASKAADQGGLNVTEKAIQPQTDGSFGWEINPGAKTGVLEINFEQGLSQLSLKYDLSKQKQIF